jgi:hypothetical protein
LFPETERELVFHSMPSVGKNAEERIETECEVRESTGMHMAHGMHVQMRKERRESTAAASAD